MIYAQLATRKIIVTEDVVYAVLDTCKIRVILTCTQLLDDRL